MGTFRISTSLIMYRSLLGLITELNKYGNEIWEVSRVITQNQCPLHEVLNLTAPPYGVKIIFHRFQKH